MTIVYLDVCCLNRPFDDQSQPRIHLEAEAILIILARFEQHEWEWLGSPVVELEVEQDPDPSHHARIKLLIEATHRVVALQAGQEQRGKALSALGIPAIDAMHLACAESGGADVFLTTDDRLLRQATRLAAQLRVRVANPLTWVKEMTEE